MYLCSRGVCAVHTVLTVVDFSTKGLNKPMMYGRAVWDMNEAPVGSCQFVTENKTASFRSEELVEPQASALAKLCAYCVFAALEFQNNATPGHVNSRKRSRRDMEGEVHSLAVVNLIAVHHTVPWVTLFLTTFRPWTKRVALHGHNTVCLFPVSTCKTCWLTFMKICCQLYAIDSYSTVIPFKYRLPVLPSFEFRVALVTLMCSFEILYVKEAYINLQLLLR